MFQEYFSETKKIVPSFKQGLCTLQECRELLQSADGCKKSLSIGCSSQEQSHRYFGQSLLEEPPISDFRGKVWNFRFFRVPSFWLKNPKTYCFGTVKKVMKHTVH